jgi:hypothetical protein
MQRLQPVQQQIKHLILWRSTFYVGDFPRQRPMSSFKELDTVYLVICNLCYRNAATQHKELVLVGTNTRLTPWLKRGGCACGLLIHDRIGDEEVPHV